MTTIASGRVKASYQVRATRWRHGWELRIDDDNITQSRSLGEADAMVREYLALTFNLSDTQVNKISIDILPFVGKTRDAAIAAAAELQTAADEARERAAAASRAVVGSLSADGLSNREIAKILKLSPQRVSQLRATKPKQKTASSALAKPQPQR